MEEEKKVSEETKVKMPNANPKQNVKSCKTLQVHVTRPTRYRLKMEKWKVEVYTPFLRFFTAAHHYLET